MNEKMQTAGEILNLKGHFAGPEEDRKLIYSCTDIEGHKGKDGRFYLLDFARYYRGPQH